MAGDEERSSEKKDMIRISSYNNIRANGRKIMTVGNKRKKKEKNTGTKLKGKNIY